MEDIFDMKSKDLKQLKKFMKTSPKEFEKATRGVLNSLAFKTRENDIKNITKSMVIRNPKFLRSSLRVQQAKSGSIDRQVAIAYFTGDCYVPVAQV